MDIRKGQIFSKGGKIATVTDVVFGYRTDLVLFTITDRYGAVSTGHSLRRASFYDAWGR